jgi:hypothetical protein
MAVAAKNPGEVGGLSTDAGWEGVIEVFPLDSEQMACLQGLLEGVGINKAGFGILSNSKQGFS